MNNILARKLELFGELPPSDRELLEEIISTPRQVEADTDMIREGERPSHVHVVLQGLVCRYQMLEDGKLEPLFTGAERHHIPLAVFRREGCGVIEAAVRKHPGMTVIIDHFNWADADDQRERKLTRKQFVISEPRPERFAGENIRQRKRTMEMP